MTDKPKPPVVLGDLTGPDGNAFVILGRCQEALRRDGRGDEWPTFKAEATAGNYDTVLDAVDKWFEVYRPAEGHVLTTARAMREEMSR